jgi:hypothetical protein
MTDLEKFLAMEKEERLKLIKAKAIKNEWFDIAKLLQKETIETLTKDANQIEKDKIVWYAWTAKEKSEK